MLFLIDDVDDVLFFRQAWYSDILPCHIPGTIWRKNWFAFFPQQKNTKSSNQNTKENTCIFHLNVHQTTWNIPINGHRGTPRNDLFCVDASIFFRFFLKGFFPNHKIGGGGGKQRWRPSLTPFLLKKFGLGLGIGNDSHRFSWSWELQEKKRCPSSSREPFGAVSWVDLGISWAISP